MTTARPFRSLSSEPLWLEQAPVPPGFLEPTPPARADVVVIGGGYTGLTAARHLARRGVDVVVLDRNGIGSGASSRNGGKALVGLKHDASTLARHHGLETARALWRSSLEGIDLIEDLVREEGVDCDFERCGSFFAAAKPGHYESMCRETEWLKEHLGYERWNVPRSEQRRELGTDAYFGGIVDEPSAGLHPAKLAVGMAEVARASGAKLCSGAEVRSVRAEGGGFRIVVRTRPGDSDSVPAAADAGPSGASRGRRDDDREIRCESVLAATNGYSGAALPSVRRRVVPVGSYIIATEVLPVALRSRISPRGRMFYDSKWFLNYFRLTPDGRMLFGGRTTISTDQHPAASARELRDDMVSFFPELEEVAVTHSWGGNLGLTFDALPHIGRVDGIHYAMGYSGHGVAMSSYLGRDVARWMLTGESESLFRRIPHPTSIFYRGRPWFRPFLGWALRLMDWIG